MLLLFFNSSCLPLKRTEKKSANIKKKQKIKSNSQRYGIRFLNKETQKLINGKARERVREIESKVKLHNKT